MTDCKEHEPLLHGLLDGELDAANALKAEQHIASCKACADVYAELQALRGVIRGANLKEPAPAQLRARVRTSIDRQRKPMAIARRFSWPAAGLIAASLFAFALFPRTPDIGLEIASSHVRSLQANHIVDVASSDHHTVKPWFAGHLDFAPPIYDIAAQGYPLVGGRVDYVNGHTVAAVVYRHNNHLINLFIWPKRDGANGPAMPETRQGYNVLHWTKLGFSCWAVSDMSPQELQRFEALVKDQTPV
jgi:anti-sigma factor (TIGR02949 family)